ncbi:hypothetical protein [uncultured Ruegeria sp.]|uniref:hypothetical protein n=1 Tax=uncultured Ruegeria sp. TaxID=259304 RepID=UPI00262C49B1|nr:hypothetical protein [uncultured Ruegeria sp.]
METPTDTQKPKFKTWAYVIFIVAFLCVWLSGMTAGLMAGACRNDRYEGSKKLRFCNISLAAGAWMNFSSLERAKRSRIELETGIALSQIEEPDRAVKAFEEALRDARAKSGHWERELHQRMVQMEDRNTLAQWVSVVEAIK